MASSPWDWNEDLPSQWQLRAGTTYLNHGSFGPPPLAVQREQQRLRRNRCAAHGFLLSPAGAVLVYGARWPREFVGTAAENLAFVDNATYAMNVIANSYPLQTGDEVLLTDHEYGAVLRDLAAIVCAQAAEHRGTGDCRLAWPVESPDQIVAAIAARMTDKTRVLVVSHITSPTAWTLPIASICQMAHERGVHTCVDGPHALVQLPSDIDSLGCDFYAASCHKWLCTIRQRIPLRVSPSPVASPLAAAQLGAIASHGVCEVG